MKWVAFALSGKNDTLLSMRKFIVWFFVFIAMYHVLNTWLVFWRWQIDGFQLAALKELVWIVLMITFFWRWRSELKEVCNNKVIWSLLSLLAGVTAIGIVVSLIQWVSPMSMIVWIKYDILPLIVVLWALMVGVLWAHYWVREKLGISLTMMIWAIVVWGVLWQWAKVLLPELFTVFGYGPIGDYVLWWNPPLWYRTGPWGMMRLQGLFAGPNNYWFFLVWFSAFFVLWVKRFLKNITLKTVLLILYFGSVVATLSRGAIVWTVVSLGLLGLILNKKRRKMIIPVWIAAVCGVVWLSILKPWSTLGHSEARNEWVKALVENPWWYGLGASWPSVHFEWVYLPENQYLWVALDIWVIGLIVWCSIVLLIMMLAVKVSVQWEKDELLLALLFGFVGLLAEWLFLHVFEDSMVNYLFLFTFGLWLWITLRLVDFKHDTFWSDRRSVLISFFSGLDDSPYLPSTRNEEGLNDSLNVWNKKD